MSLFVHPLGANMRRLLNLLACLALFVVGCIINGPTALRDSLDDSELLPPSNPPLESSITVSAVSSCSSPIAAAAELLGLAAVTAFVIAVVFVVTLYASFDDGHELSSASRPTLSNRTD
jgi:hypothetical protein